MVIKAHFFGPQLKHQNHNNVKLICLVLRCTVKSVSHPLSADHHMLGLFILFQDNWSYLSFFKWLLIRLL